MNIMKRRKFITQSITAAAGTIAFPAIVPSTIFGRTAPGNKINIGKIGFGRIAMTHDLAETLKYDVARVVALAEVDSNLASKGKQFIENYYTKKTGSKAYIDVKTSLDYHDILSDKNIDAVIISTPDEWHSKAAIEAALSGKDIYLQIPSSLTISEGRLLCDVVKKRGVIFQAGMQQRSMTQFRIAAEMVRNGRIGKLETVKIGLPFGAGAITGLGQHHFDSAAWGMDTELTGPVSVEAVGQFPESGLWEVHGNFIAKADYKNGITMLTSGVYPDGVRFEGTEGWIFVKRAIYTKSESNLFEEVKNAQALKASDPKILSSVIKENETHLYVSDEQHGNWLDCIRSRKEPISPVETGHRACTVGLVTYIAMKTGRKLNWDPDKEKFVNDNEANSMLSGSQRAPYGTG
jgi:myo-inositol 2-dehydrogenase / D-chiro-inositol 1-dehydrogenase